jgi:hypothetical protein
MQPSYHPPAQMPVYHQPTPSPQKRVVKKLVQETLTQNDWGARPVPAGWKAHCDASGSTFYYNKTINQWVPKYELMFETDPVETQEDEDEVEIVTQRYQSSHASSQDSQGTILSNGKKPFKKRQPDVREEVDTQDLPGSDFMLPKRAEVVDVDEKENRNFQPDADEHDDEMDTQPGEGDQEEESVYDDDATQW